MTVNLHFSDEPLTALEAWARVNAETLTYLVFFGLLAVFGLLELVVARSRAKQERVRRWSANALLTASWVIAGAAVPLSLLAASDWAKANGVGLLNAQFVAPWASLAGGVLARSLVSYLTHLSMHKIPLLWRIHRVHHMDTQLDISTTARFHPLEAIASAPFALAGVVVFGVPPLAVLLYEIMDAAIVVFSHANIRLPDWLDRVLRFVVVTPNMHRIHHSASQPETDSNFGATLTLWDRLFGTYRRKPSEDLAGMMLGLTEVQDGHASNLFWLLVSPVLSRTRLDGRAK
jgi:sterol desaturase/sphingolipid hydroxylase (fatty acid hydroxylase superfamily)